MTQRTCRSPLLLSTILVATTACSPACTPPDVEPDVTQQRTTQTPAADSSEAGEQLPPPEDMITDAPGVDLAKLDDAQRATFFQISNVEPGACEKPMSLIKGINEDAEGCKDHVVLGQFVADLIAQGAMPGDVKLTLDEVRKSLIPHEIDITNRPVYGNENAPVTMVVFADFECPHCRQEAPVLRKLVQDRRGQVKMVYRHYPLNMHPRARVAAIACEAALEQGKFWEMHDAVFDHQTQLEDEDLERYAKGIEGLDFAAWQAHFDAKKGEKQVEADRAAGDKLGITGTPAVFVNGRYFHPGLFGGTLDGWVDDALRR